MQTEDTHTPLIFIADANNDILQPTQLMSIGPAATGHETMPQKHLVHRWCLERRPEKVPSFCKSSVSARGACWGWGGVHHQSTMGDNLTVKLPASMRHGLLISHFLLAGSRAQSSSPRAGPNQSPNPVFEGVSPGTIPGSDSMSESNQDTKTTPMI